MGKSLELSNSTYRAAPTAADVEAFNSFNGEWPNVDTHPYTFAWYSLVIKFTPAVKETWAAAGAQKGGKKEGGKKEAAKPAKKEEEAPKKADDDDVDLFGSDDEDDEVNNS